METEEEKKKYRNSEILANKSRELLNDQLQSVDANNSKAGIFISISALFIPLAFSLFEKFNTSIMWIFTFFIPIGLNLIGLFFLVKALFPKKLYHGINFSEFENLLQKSEDQLFKFEIGINRDSFRDNSEILKNQNQYLKNGLIIIFISAIVLACLTFLNIIITKCNCNG